jgi:hypothetical protein
MSDIAITFPWPVLLLAFGAMGWPGLLIGAGLGAALWRRHRIVGALLGAVVLDVGWAAAWVRWS